MKTDMFVNYKTKKILNHISFGFIAMLIIIMCSSIICIADSYDGPSPYAKEHGKIKGKDGWAFIRVGADTKYDVADDGFQFNDTILDIYGSIKNKKGNRWYCTNLGWIDANDIELVDDNFGKSKNNENVKYSKTNGKTFEYGNMIQYDEKLKKKESIKWIVYDTYEGMGYYDLVSEKIIDIIDTKEINCYVKLKEYLNNDFINNCFTEEEQKNLCKVEDGTKIRLFSQTEFKTPNSYNSYQKQFHKYVTEGNVYPTYYVASKLKPNRNTHFVKYLTYFDLHFDWSTERYGDKDDINYAYIDENGNLNRLDRLSKLEGETIGIRPVIKLKKSIVDKK